MKSHIIYYIFIVFLMFSGCSFSHRDGGVTIVDLNGYFSGSVIIENIQTQATSTVTIDAAIVQTITSLYGTLTGNFNGFQEELRITGSVDGLTIVIFIEEGIGPVTASGTAEERSATLKGTFQDNDDEISVTLILSSDNILPIIREGVM